MKMKCHICEKEFDYLKGLLGHLRFAHKLSEEEITQIQQQYNEVKMEKDILDTFDELLERLRRIRQRLNELDEIKKENFWSEDETIKEFKRLYQKEEKRIKEELRELQKKVGQKKEEDEDWF